MLLMTANYATAVELIEMSKNIFSAHSVHTSGSAIAEGPREALVSRNPATTKHLT